MNRHTITIEMSEKMLKLLVIGGYGTFGGRLVRLLEKEPRLTIIIAGRSLHKAETFIASCNGPATLEARSIDRDEDLQQQIVDIGPDYVIDASGPWQNYGADAWRVAEAAISSGTHYLDLADSTEFVCGISALNDSALQEGVTALSGLSTCPALTAAVVRELSREFESVESIAGGISPSPFAGMGRSVVNAIASYAGKSVAVLQSGVDTPLHTFVSTRRLVVRPAGVPPLPPMVFSLVDLPDLQLLGKVIAKPQSVWFGVATRPAIYHSLLRLLAWGVKTGLFSSLRYLAGIMYLFVNHLSWGEHRGGLMIEIKGRDQDGKTATRSWHLLAEGDSGPNVPVLASTAIIRSHLDGRPPQPGARPAHQELELADFQSLFAEIGVTVGTHMGPSPVGWPLFREILGDAWLELPPEIQELHGDKGCTSFAGSASVERGNSVLSRIIGKLIGVPAAAASIPVEVVIEPSNGKEWWTRDFSGYRFGSEYSRGKGRIEGLICERFGPVRIGMALVWDGTQLNFIPRRWSFLGIPMPGALAPSGNINESVVDGKFQFDVEIRLPFAGHVVTYKGWLEPKY
ncbi:MAG: DUF4166 domain-containing protein [Woeseiaceae bacterium]